MHGKSGCTVNRVARYDVKLWIWGGSPGELWITGAVDRVLLFFWIFAKCVETSLVMRWCVNIHCMGLSDKSVGVQWNYSDTVKTVIKVFSRKILLLPFYQLQFVWPLYFRDSKIVVGFLSQNPSAPIWWLITLFSPSRQIVFWCSMQNFIKIGQ